MDINNKIKHIITFRYNRLIKNLGTSSLFYKIKFQILLPLGIFDQGFLNEKLDKNWIARIDDVKSCPDNLQIDRVPNAGAVKNGKQIMHNGIAITVGGYYGGPITQMLKVNKGVHEPQEELAFHKVLSSIPENATMLELGSYWSFYSIWFQKKIKGAKTHMVEPEVVNLLYGKNNFRINNVSGKFTNAYVGKESRNINGAETITVDGYMTENNISFLDILHSDIQGFELDMLYGAANAIKSKSIGYFFISTHGNDIHYKCLSFLKDNNYAIVCNADENETFSFDGLIVAKSPNYKGINNIPISLKTKLTTQIH